MLKKSYFTQLKKALEKTSDGLIGVQRAGDYVYILNGHIIVKMDHLIYKNYMDRNMFPDIDDGKSISRRFKTSYKEWNPDGFKIKEMIDDCEKDIKHAKLTKLTMDLNNDSNESARLIVCNKQLIAINDIYYQAAINFCKKSMVYGTNRKAPVLMYSHLPDDNPSFTFLILPINLRDYDDMTLSDFLAT